MSAIEELQRQIDRLASIVEGLLTTERTPIVANYSTNAGQNCNNGAVTIVNFEDVIDDPRSAVTTGTSWKFTAPAAGYYLVSASVLFAQTNTWADGEGIVLFIYKGGVELTRLHYNDWHGSASNVYVGANGSKVIHLAKSDYIDIRVQQASGAALALHTDGAYNWVSIARL